MKITKEELEQFAVAADVEIDIDGTDVCITDNFEGFYYKQKSDETYEEFYYRVAIKWGFIDE